MSSAWIRGLSPELGIELFLHCQPGAKKTEIQGIHGDRLKVRLAAPPLEGRANDALIAWLAKTLGVPKSHIELVSGDTGRQKRIKIMGLGVDQVKAQFKVD